MAPLRLTREQARRAMVGAQLLGEPRPAGVLETLRHLGSLQVDPTAIVARTEQLVLWSRLGEYRAAELGEVVHARREAFEYWAFIVPAADFAVHRETMRRFPSGAGVRSVYIREWLKQNAGFRRYILDRLRRSGPQRSRELEDRAAVPWRSGGWNDGKNLGRMLDLLWMRGDIAIAGRDGQQRLWDLAERILPLSEPRLAPSAVARRLLEVQLGARGVAPADRIGYPFDRESPGRERALQALVREGVAVPVAIDGVPGAWYAHAPALERPFAGRTTLLSPFDRLVYDRDRTQQLFGFRYRFELYVPADKRVYGTYVLPILHDDRLVGRIDPRFDARQGTLRLNAVHAEAGAPAAAAEPIAAAVASLARWLGAERVALGEPVHAPWRRALADLA